MIEIDLSIEINVSAGRVWTELSEIATHPEWMEDLSAVRFTGSKHDGIGTTYEYDTKIKFFSSTDEILVTQWNDRRSIAFSRKGAFTSTGSWSLTPSQDGATTFNWREEISFPLHYGGPIGELIARSAINKTWHNDMLSLKAKAEGPREVNPLDYFTQRNVRVITAFTAGRWVVELRGQTDGAAIMKNYASGKSAYAARLAAVNKWKAENDAS